MIAVIGLGLLGGSVLRTAAGAGATARGWDLDAATRADAREAGLDVAETVGEAVAGADLVVLAVPLRAMSATARTVAPLLGPDAVVTDVGSVKGPVRAAMVEAGITRFVGAHPMAGTEESGFAASRADLLPGARWAVTVDAATDVAAFTAVLGLVCGALGGEVSVLTDGDHDAAVALVSHVPHVLATQLLSLVTRSGVRDVALGLAAGSFRDGTRVGLTDPRKTEAMVTANAAAVAPVLRDVAEDLESLASALEAAGAGQDVDVAAFFDEPAPVRALRGEPTTSDTVATRLTSREDLRSLAVAGAEGAVVVSVGDGVVQVRGASVL
ncbi:prephenate dehydrogenase [Paraoerskovia marina]|uniref:prephenate dehydrogenase n=1 Tax=Paraoerskovia marina TaxID=545619 RepID=UPI0006934D90|nr:prephenate dehydrogenase/arogenate dehydrogenase family protein [Paraoerskovia marina]